MAADTRRMAPVGGSQARENAKHALLDAAERMLVEVGHAGITTRKLAAKAGVNPGLVHYYFGSMEELFVQVLERFTEKLTSRQREMYASPGPFIEKWNQAWDFQEDDLDEGYSKIWLELQALAWNHPELQARVTAVDSEWRGILSDAFTKALDDYGISDRLPPDVVVPMVMMFAQGFALERLSGINDGQETLLTFIRDWLEGLEAAHNA